MVDGEAEDTYLKLDQWTKVLFIIISTSITCCQRYEMSRADSNITLKIKSSAFYVLEGSWLLDENN